jgi:WD40 repeat protein
VGSKAAISILAGHSDNVKKVKILDDFRVISASSDKTVKIWDLRKTAEPTCKFVVENPIEDFCLAKG